MISEHDSVDVLIGIDVGKTDRHAQGMAVAERTRPTGKHAQPSNRDLAAAVVIDAIRAVRVNAQGEAMTRPFWEGEGSGPHALCPPHQAARALSLRTDATFLVSSERARCGGCGRRRVAGRFHPTWPGRCWM